MVYGGGDPREPHELVNSAHVGISRLHLTYSWAQALGTGEFLSGSGKGRCAFIAREDCARAAAAALASPSAANRVYNITGRVTLTIDQVMEMLSKINGRPIRVVHMSPEQLLARLSRRARNWRRSSPLSSKELRKENTIMKAPTSKS